MQTVAAVADAAWQDVLAEQGSPVVEPLGRELPLVHAQLIAGALTEHLAHRFLLLNRVRLPPGTTFRPLPARKPLPPAATWQADAEAFMVRCLHQKLTLQERTADKVNLHKWLGDQVLRRHAAENAPLTKAKLHGQLVCNLEQRLFKRLVHDTAEWWRDFSRDTAGTVDEPRGYAANAALRMV